MRRVRVFIASLALVWPIALLDAACGESLPAGGDLDATDEIRVHDGSRSSDAEVTPDAVSIDAASDAVGTNADADAATVPPTAGDFILAVKHAVCDRVRECCAVPTANWDYGFCMAALTNADSPWGIASREPFVDGGLVSFDVQKAIACLADIHSLSCDTTSSQWLSARLDCFAALVGVSPLDAGCRNAIECAPPGTCALDAGRCAPVGEAGSPCATTDDCTYRGGTVANYCDDSITPGSGACASPKLLDGSCNASDRWLVCSSGLCDDPSMSNTLVCVAQAVLPKPAICKGLKLADAGTD